MRVKFHFAMTQNFKEQRRRDGKSFYCPTGHPQHYTDSIEVRHAKEIETYKKVLEETKQSLDYWQAEEGRYRGKWIAMKGQVTKLKKKTI